MTPRTKSALLLACALVIGVLLGALASGAMVNRRLATIAELRTSRGMAFVLERVVRPETEEQRRAFRDLIEESAPNYADVFARTGRELTALNDSLLARVRPLLTPEQAERLESHLRMTRGRRFGGDRDRARRGREGPNHRRSRPPPDGTDPADSASTR
ncbi:MAG: hypothetical protein OEM96_05665 [Gemmatimonadota bacterium]|nr:hypothetical protein [Gemmatimonadota bacterium]